MPVRRIRWIPRQHGAWAMLAVPLLVGVAASRASGWQVLLAVAAFSAYLASAPALEWVRARRREYGVPAIAFGILLAVAGIPLVLAWPALTAVAAWAVAMSAVAALAALGGRPRSLIASLAEAAQALALVPAAALVSGEFADAVAAFSAPAVLRATLLAGTYLIGTVLLVRSMIRERAHDRFLWLSIGFHVAGIAAAVTFLAWPYVALTAALAGRAAALPVMERRLAQGHRRLRPIHIGLVEILASAAVVLVAFMAAF